MPIGIIKWSINIGALGTTMAIVVGIVGVSFE